MRTGHGCRRSEDGRSPRGLQAGREALRREVDLREVGIRDLLPDDRARSSEMQHQAERVRMQGPKGRRRVRRRPIELLRRLRRRDLPRARHDDHHVVQHHDAAHAGPKPARHDDNYDLAAVTVPHGRGLPTWSFLRSSSALRRRGLHRRDTCALPG
jgi:hypothetical protein